MIVRLDNPKILSDAISIISEIVTEVRIKLLDEGMSIVAVDPANISMVIFKIPKESFSQYEAGKDVWGINLEDFKRVLKRAASSSSIILSQEENQLQVSIFDKIKRNFVLSLIDVSSEDKTEPVLNFSCEVEMNAQELSQVIEDCSVVADSCSFLAEPNKLIIEGSGSLNSAKAEFSSGETKIQGTAKSKYSLEYLMKFIKAKSLSDRVTLKFSNDYPLRMDFAGQKLGMGFILAPRVEND
jgi:proliferating cell nuclear antigen